MRRGWRAISATMVAVAAVGLLSTTPAVADTRMAFARGSCTAESHWRLVLIERDHRMGVGFKVVQGVVGNIWRVKIAQNRHMIFRALQATHGEDGSFAVRSWTRNTRGWDFFRARARNLATGEVCFGRAVI